MSHANEYKKGNAMIIDNKLLVKLVHHKDDKYIITMRGIDNHVDSNKEYTQVISIPLLSGIEIYSIVVRHSTMYVSCTTNKNSYLMIPNYADMELFVNHYGIVLALYNQYNRLMNCINAGFVTKDNIHEFIKIIGFSELHKCINSKYYLSNLRSKFLISNKLYKKIYRIVRVIDHAV